MENNANQLNSMLCKRNCGFFGNAAYDGYCSKCYKDHVKRQNSGSAAGRVTPTTSTTTNVQHISTAVATATSTNEIHTLPSESSTMPQVASNTTVVSETAPPVAGTPTQPIAIPARPTTATNITETVSLSSSSPSAEADSEQPVPQFVVPPSVEPMITTETGLETSAATPIIVEPSPPPQQQQQLQQSMLVPNTSSPQLSSSMMSTDGSESTLNMMMSSSLPAAAAAAETKKKRTRCCVESCKRKVGLTGFDCRCGGLFCWEHRYSDKHDCKFDYKEHGQDQIRKNNPIVIGEKIQKI